MSSNEETAQLEAQLCKRVIDKARWDAEVKAEAEQRVVEECHVAEEKVVVEARPVVEESRGGSSSGSPVDCQGKNGSGETEGHLRGRGQVKGQGGAGWHVTIEAEEAGGG